MVSRAEYDRWKDELGLICTFEELNARVLTDIAMDEIGSMAMARGFEALAEKRRLGLLPPLPPKESLPPKQSLVQACLDLGWIDARPEWQRQGLPQPPTDDE